ncbi:MAG: hypothetical protein HOL98_07585 [Gammaproteobacteria bacterium]|jgi:hypothetical protein|nr:hypothetical protein [Gammaproteobacteria bacterium]MBT5203301.1 hypothetical protein [Gammaproteobacteria bacterium]MBT5603556.1 hypothetical protein [Gammaproteobacteria bacterium]MBT6244443.1 hypothetical protein [Gammaproteobacteria bacterium]
MKLFKLSVVFAVLSWSWQSWANHHEEVVADSNHYVLHSIYEIAYGQDPDTLEAELVTYQKGQEALGFNNCGLYKHEYGSQRAFYTFCYFNDFDQFGAIMKKAEAAGTGTGAQNFATHSDNILEVQQRNLKASPDRVAYMTWRFGPYLSLADRQARADQLFDVFSRAFGECNLYHHAWGSDLGHYMSCGFKDYTDFGKKYNAVNKILSDELMDAKLDILEHSDELLIKIMD